MRKFFLLSFLVAAAFQTDAQKKVEYYPNGVKKFEGDYFYAWKSTDAAEFVSPMDTASLYDPGQRDITELDMYLNMFPTKEYEGLCAFYYTNGKKAFEGNYSRGVKNGLFKYWWIDGTLVAEKRFVNGMADGKWLTYGLSKEPMVTESYRAFSQAELDTLFREIAGSLTSRRNTEDKEMDRHWRNMQDRRKIRFDHRDEELTGAYRFTRQMDDFLKTLQQRSIWDGEFIYMNSETKKKAIEMYFKDNVPVGTWKVWDGEGKVEMEGSFKDGKLVKFKDHRPAPKPSEPTTTSPKEETPMQRKAPKSEKAVAEDALKEPPPTIMEAPAPPDVFKYVEQMPEAPYDVTQYIGKNLKLPATIAPEDHGATIFVNFTVLEDGTIDNAKIIGSKRHSVPVEQAVLEVINSMPKWKPGRQNGKAVKVDYTLPFIIETE